MTVERYIGFYTSRPFWAEKKVDFDNIENIKNNFYEIMSQEVFIYDTDEYILKICKDGMFLFQIKEIAKQLDESYKSGTHPDIKHTIRQWSTYLDYLNCIYLLFESSVLKKLKIGHFEISEITNQDAFDITFENGKFSGDSISLLSFASKFQMGRSLSNYISGVPLTIDPRISFRKEIPKIAFDTLHTDFSKAYKDYNKVKMLAETTKSLGEYKIANYSTSLILSWFVIESYLVTYWKKLLDSKNTTYDDGTKRISSERMDSFINRDYPISVILNMLELFDAIDFETFRKINEVRRCRNKIVHKRISCEPEHCKTAFDVLKEFIKNETGINLELNLGYSIRGL